MYCLSGVRALSTRYASPAANKPFSRTFSNVLSTKAQTFPVHKKPYFQVNNVFKSWKKVRETKEAAESTESLTAVVESSLKNSSDSDLTFVRSDGEPEEFKVTHYTTFKDLVTPESVRHAIDTAQTAESIYLSAVLLLNGHVGYVAKDVTKAKELMYQAAEMGSTEAMITIGCWFNNGDHETPNPRESHKWILKAAVQGNENAAFIVGGKYRHGTGVSQSKAKALKWYNEAAERGHIAALHAMVDVSDRPTLMRHYEKHAFKNGNAEAMFLLGENYNFVPQEHQSDRLAMHWYLKAANLGHVDATIAVVNMYLEGRGVSPECVKLISNLKQKQGDEKISRYYLGAYYYWGFNTLYSDPDTSLNYFQTFLQYRSELKNQFINPPSFTTRIRNIMRNYYAPNYNTEYDNTKNAYNTRESGYVRNVQKIVNALQGDAEAMDTLGVYCETADHLPHSNEKAMFWYTAAAEQGVGSAMFNIAMVYDEKLEYETAIQWLLKAVDAGYGAQAAPFLAAYYEEGAGVEKNILKAVEWWEKAAEFGDTRSMLHLGSKFKTGLEGVEEDMARANRWLLRAAVKGDTKAAVDADDLWWELESYSEKTEIFKESYYILKDATTPGAVYLLGCLFDRGYYVEQDHNVSFACWLKSAEHGFTRAFIRIGDCYMHGQGIAQNLDEALYFYKIAADRGSATAMKNMAFVYGDKDDAESEWQWLMKAANKGNKEAMHIVAREYQAGLDGEEPPDLETAVNWFYKAAQQGHSDSMLEIGNIFVAKKEYEEAWNWFHYALDAGSVYAYYSIGFMHYEGEFVEKDYDKALEWFLLGAEHDSRAANAIGAMYVNGEGVPEDYRIAAEWFLKAASMDSPISLYNMGQLFELDDEEDLSVVQANMQTAVEFYMIAAKEGDPNAMYRIGEIYLEGELVEKNYDMAFHWIEQAAELDLEEAQLALSLMYSYGRGVTADADMADKWMKRAAAQGNEEAMLLLGESPEEEEESVSGEFLL